MNDFFVFSDLVRYKMCLSFCFNKYVRMDISSYLIVFKKDFMGSLSVHVETMRGSL